MAPTATPSNKAISCTVPQDVYDALEEHRWSIRQSMSGMIGLACAEYLSNHGITVGSAGAPKTEDTKADKAPAKP